MRKLPSNERRSRRVVVLMNEKEYEQVVEKAKLMGRSVSDAIRWAFLHEDNQNEEHSG